MRMVVDFSDLDQSDAKHYVGGIWRGILALIIATSFRLGTAGKASRCRSVMRPLKRERHTNSCWSLADDRTGRARTSGEPKGSHDNEITVAAQRCARPWKAALDNSPKALTVPSCAPVTALRSRWRIPAICGLLKGLPQGHLNLRTPSEWTVQPPTWWALISLPAGWKRMSSNLLSRPGRPAAMRFMILPRTFRSFLRRVRTDHPLPWIKLDKQTWRVNAGGARGTVHVHYQVFANDLTGSFSQVDSEHANLNGPSVFMYVDEHKPDPIDLTIEAPAQWKVISGFQTSTTERTFHAPNYDRLVDTPAGNLRELHPRPVSGAGEDHRGCGAHL